MSTLKPLIPSKTRVKILELFFQNSGQTYFLRQVVRSVEEEVNAVKRELDILEGAKVLTKEKRLNKVFYTINKHYVFYEEFIKIFTKTTPLANAIYSVLPKLGKVKFIVVSTKYTRNIAIREDEIYAMFVGTIVVPEVAALMQDIEKQLGRDMNYTVMNEEEFAFRKRNNDPFIWRFLRQPKVMIVGAEEEYLK